MELVEPDPTPIEPLDPIVWVEDAEPQMPPAVPDHPDRRDDPAWEEYHRAFAALEDGNRTYARNLLGALVRRNPDHPASEAAERITEALDLAPENIDTDQPERPHAEHKSSNARAELALVQTAHGTMVGVELCNIAGCDQTEQLALALVGGVATAVGVLGFVDNVEPGVVTAVDSGSAWGFVEGALISEVTYSHVSAPALLMQTAGTLTGALVATTHPRAGTVAAMNSGGLWGVVLGLCVTQALEESPGEQKFGIVGLFTLNLGLGVGAAIGYTHSSIDRGDTMIYDVGGITGLLVGSALVHGLSSNATDQALYGGAAIGAVAGLGMIAGIVHVLQKKHHRGGAAASTFVVPPPDHARGGIAGLGWKF